MIAIYSKETSLTTKISNGILGLKERNDLMTFAIALAVLLCPHESLRACSF